MHLARRQPARQIGTIVSARELKSVAGQDVALPDRDRLIHLQLRRFAGCPVCNLHLRSIVRRHDEIDAAGVREIVVFHSPSEELAKHTAGLPFAVIADPSKRLYAEFGAESAPRALLNPSVWAPIVRAVLRSTWTIARGRERRPAWVPHGGRLGLPAEFLIATDGRIVANKYGEHAYDQWSVDELLEVVAQVPAG